MGVMKISYIKYALIMCVVVIFALCMMELTGQNRSFDSKSPLQIFLLFIAPFIITWLGISQKRKSLKNKINFKKGFTEGFKIFLAFGVLSSLIYLAYYTFINPQIVDSLQTSYGLFDSPFEVVVAFDMFMQFISAIIFGSIYSAIIALLLRTKKK